MEWIDNSTLLYLKGDSFEDSSLYKHPISSSGISLSQNGKFGSCFDFTTNTGSIFVDDDTRFPQGEFTIDWWANNTGKVVASSSLINNLSSSSDTSTRSFHIGKTGGTGANVTSIFISSNNSTDWDISSNIEIGNVCEGEWVHRAVVNDGANIKCYENGVLFTSIPLNGKSIFPLDEKIRIGLLRAGTTPYGEYVSDIRISNVALWNSDFTPPTKQHQRQFEAEINENIINVKINNKNISKLEILINKELCKSYNSELNNVAYEIDISKCQIGDNEIVVRCVYNGRYCEETLNYIYTPTKLTDTSSLKDVVDMQIICNNTIEKCKNDLRNNLIDKGVECDEEDKFIALINKIKSMVYIEGYYKLPQWYISQIVDGVDCWLTCKSMTSARRSLTSSVVGDKIYVFGGSNSSNTILSSNECYDTVKNTWVTKGAMTTARMQLTSSAVGDEIYVMNGYNNGGISRNECYNTLTNTWTNKQTIDNRYGLTSNTIGKGIYVLGGIDASGFYQSKNLYYDTLTNTWSSKKNMLGTRGDLTSSVVGDKIYVLGGESGSSLYTKTECYNTSTNTWTTKKDIPTARRGLTSSVVGDGIYAIGGIISNGTTSSSLNECYNTLTNTWSTKENMADPRSYLASSSIGDKIYVLGGVSGSSHNSKNECYIP